jgi:ABC-type phosphate transport system substrate-binding protein
MLIRLLLTTLLFGVAVQAHADDFAVITLNPNLKELRVNQVKLIYRGRVSHINGVHVRLLDLPRKSQNREGFYRQLLNKSPTQMSAIWARLSFSGKAIAPAEISSETPDEVIQWLKSNSNGIAYLPTDLLPEDAYVIYQLSD